MWKASQLFLSKQGTVESQWPMSFKSAAKDIGEFAIAGFEIAGGNVDE
jgi:hypothetical protein